MSNKHLLAVIGLGLLGSAALAEPLGTAFTYQGRLVENDQPASGWYAMSFKLWDDASRGLALGQPQLEDRVTVSNGLFTVTLDFGVDQLGRSCFRGDARWLEIGVDHYKGTNYATLVPRQPLTPTPYALYTSAAGSVPASGLTGTMPDARLSANVALLNSSPTFTGTVQAAQFQGGGADLTGIIPADNSVTSAKIVDSAVAAVDLASEVASLHKVSGGHLTVDAAGNVGLGVSTPGFPLSFASATGDKISLYGTGTNHYGLGIQSGLLQIHGSTAGADIAFGYGSSTNFTEQMRIKGNGNVGIGTAAPAYPLDVRADQAVGRFLSTNGAEVSVLVLGNTAATARWLGAINFNSSSGNPGQISYATNTGLTFDAGGVERLRITPDGGVGIGTSDPAGAALNVAGTVRATQFQGGGAGLTGVIPADNSVTSAKILNGAILNADLADNSVNADKIADGSVTSLKIADNAVAAVDLASEVASLHKVSGGHLTVDAVGNVGLGVSTPGFPLNFASTSGDKISLYGTSTNHYGLGIQAGLLQIHGSTASADIAFGYGSSANFTEQMRIQGNGNIGIGTNDPQATLHVRGDLLVESATVAKLGALRVELGNSTAGANYATAMGHSTADGSYSTAMGASTANGNYSTALGYSTASGSYATALGTSTAQGTGATALGYLSAATTNYSLAAGRRAKANHEGSFVWADSQNADFASTDHDQVRIRATNGVHLVAPKLVLEDFGPAFELRSTAGDSSGMMSYLPYNLWTGPPSILFSIKDSQVMRLYEQTNGVGGMDVYGPVSATAFNPFSDRNMKENFAPVEAQAVLDKVIALPISRWNFKGDTATPHVGPMAQDFHAAFQTGSDDKHIATVDADGVALAAIQGLNQKLEAKNAALEQEMAELKTLVKALAEKVNGGGQ